MADADHQHNQFTVFDPAKNAVVIYPEAPELPKIAFEAFAELAGVLGSRDPRIKELKDPAGGFMTQLAELLESLGADFIPKTEVDRLFERFLYH